MSDLVFHGTGALIGAVIGLLIGLLLLALLGLLLRWLWNTTLPDVLGVKRITTVQAIKIMLLSSMLFGGHRLVTGVESHGGARGTVAVGAFADDVGAGIGAGTEAGRD